MEPTIESARKDRRLRALFFALALLYVIPFWVVGHVPTVDGPCHTYNAWVLHQYGNVERYPLFQQYYEISAKPYPNWIGQAVMALLMYAVPPVAAEKLLVSGYALLFLAGAWYLVGAVRPEERWLAFLAFPFVCHQLFQFGFYNFAISVAFFLLGVGFWWRHRDRPGDLRFAVGINLLLWLCYFSHILSLGLALVAISVLWLATLRRETWRRHLLHVAILLPQAVLPLWFFVTQGGGRMPSTWPLAQMARFLVRLEVLVTLNVEQLWLTVPLALLFLLLLLVTLRRGGLWSPESAFLLLAPLFIVLYFVSPDGAAGGWLLKNRLSLYPYLILLPGLSPRLGRRGAALATGVLTLAALGNLGYLIQGYRGLGAEVDGFLAGLEPVAPNSRELTLLFERTWPTDVLSHATGYVALEKGLIDWDNYEAKTSYFSVRFRDSVEFPEMAGVPVTPGSYRVRPNVRRVDAVYLWRMPLGHPLGTRLRRHYMLTREDGEGMLFERGGG